MTSSTTKTAQKRCIDVFVWLYLIMGGCRILEKGMETRAKVLLSKFY